MAEIAILRQVREAQERERFRRSNARWWNVLKTTSLIFGGAMLVLGGLSVLAACTTQAQRNGRFPDGRRVDDGS
jgi:hypothetical protein